jgi:predicted nucleic acid-binding protein
MKLVVDASVAIKWVVKEIDSQKARQLRDDCRKGITELIAPDHYPLELANSLTKLERRGILIPPASLTLLSDILMDPISLIPHAPLLFHAAAISSKSRLAVYDCLYVALAEREGCELVTADVKMFRNLSESPIVMLASL